MIIYTIFFKPDCESYNQISSTIPYFFLTFTVIIPIIGQTIVASRSSVISQQIYYWKVVNQKPTSSYVLNPWSIFLWQVFVRCSFSATFFVKKTLFLRRVALLIRTEQKLITTHKGTRIDWDLSKKDHCLAFFYVENHTFFERLDVYFVGFFISCKATCRK